MISVSLNIFSEVWWDILRRENNHLEKIRWGSFLYGLCWQIRRSSEIAPLPVWCFRTDSVPQARSKVLLLCYRSQDRCIRWNGDGVLQHELHSHLVMIWDVGFFQVTAPALWANIKSMNLFIGYFVIGKKPAYCVFYNRSDHLLTFRISFENWVWSFSYRWKSWKWEDRCCFRYDWYSMSALQPHLSEPWSARWLHPVLWSVRTEYHPQTASVFLWAECIQVQENTLDPIVPRPLLFPVRKEPYTVQKCFCTQILYC